MTPYIKEKLVPKENGLVWSRRYSKITTNKLLRRYIPTSNLITRHLVSVIIGWVYLPTMYVHT
jgi:hypothetical protein